MAVLPLLKAIDTRLQTQAHLQVLAAAACFAVLEVLLAAALRPTFAQWIINSTHKRNPRLSAAKLEQSAERDAATAITKLVGSVHNAIQIPAAVRLLLAGGLAADAIHATSPAGHRLVIISAGYFLYDLAQVIARFDQEGAAYLVHALACLSVYLYSALLGRLEYYGAAFMLWELSSPLVHLRWFMYKLGREDSPAYLANGLAMMAAFFASRCVWGTAMSAKFWADTAHELGAQGQAGAMPAPVIWAARAANVALNCLNWWWLSKMVGKVAGMAAGKKASQVRVGKED